MVRRKETERTEREKSGHSINALIERYREIAEKVQAENKQYAIKLDQEASEEVTVKYRLVLRPTPRGIIHTLEILDATEERSAIQIPLIGRDWERVLSHADRVINSMTAEKFREISDLLIELAKRLNLGGRSSVTEVE